MNSLVHNNSFLDTTVSHCFQIKNNNIHKYIFTFRKKIDYIQYLLNSWEYPSFFYLINFLHLFYIHYLLIYTVDAVYWTRS